MSVHYSDQCHHRKRQNQLETNFVGFNSPPRRFAMIAVSGLFAVFSVAVSVTQFFISIRTCGLYAVAGCLVAFNVLPGTVIASIHCYD